MVCLAWLGAPAAWSQSGTAARKPVTGEITATTASNPKEVGNQLREALGTEVSGKKKLLINVSKVPSGGGAPANPSAPRSKAKQAASTELSNGGQSSRQYIEARAAAMAGGTPGPALTVLAEAAPAQSANAITKASIPPDWAYEGDKGPLAWGQLRPEYQLCAQGQRQSPINIEEGSTLVGPAEAIEFSYLPSQGTVVNTGRTIRVEVDGPNSIFVRGSRYKLSAISFHSPSEMAIHHRRFAMEAQLHHVNEQGQAAIVAVLFDAGAANPVIEKIWTYMPLDVGDRVEMPRSTLYLSELLPGDTRYFQFMGSLTTPPCTEGVLWVVLKQPVSLSPQQLRLFTQLYPHNARPVQRSNQRPVREAQ
jgi:carbonic anhydrase